MAAAETGMVLEDATDEEREELMKLLGVDDETDLENALEGFVAEEFGITADVVTRTGWNIRDQVDGDPGDGLRMADWASQKVVSARISCTEVDAVAEQQKAQIDRWRDAEKRKHQNAEAFFHFVLQQYHEDFHAGENSVALPCGVKLTMKKNRARIVWDDDAALGFAHAQEMVGVIKETLAKTPFKERFEKQADGSFVYSSTGEVVEFVRMEQPDEERTFDVV